MDFSIALKRGFLGLRFFDLFQRILQSLFLAAVDDPPLAGFPNVFENANRPFHKVLYIKEHTCQADTPVLLITDR